MHMWFGTTSSTIPMSARLQGGGQRVEVALGAELGVQAVVVDDVVAVHAARPRGQDRRRVNVGDPQVVEVINQRGCVTKGKVLVELQTVRGARDAWGHRTLRNVTAGRSKASRRGASVSGPTVPSADRRRRVGGGAMSWPGVSVMGAGGAMSKPGADGAGGRVRRGRRRLAAGRRRRRSAGPARCRATDRSCPGARRSGRRPTAARACALAGVDPWPRAAPGHGRLSSAWPRGRSPRGSKAAQARPGPPPRARAPRQGPARAAAGAAGRPRTSCAAAAMAAGMRRYAPVTARTTAATASSTANAARPRCWRGRSSTVPVGSQSYSRRAATAGVATAGATAGRAATAGVGGRHRREHDGRRRPDGRRLVGDQRRGGRVGQTHRGRSPVGPAASGGRPASASQAPCGRRPSRRVQAAAPRSACR